MKAKLIFSIQSKFLFKFLVLLFLKSCFNKKISNTELHFELAQFSRQISDIPYITDLLPVSITISGRKRKVKKKAQPTAKKFELPTSSSSGFFFRSRVEARRVRCMHVSTRNRDDRDRRAGNSGNNHEQLRISLFSELSPLASSFVRSSVRRSAGIVFILQSRGTL